MKKYIAECIGTFVLTFLGCGAAVSLSCGTDAASVVGTAIAFGLSVVAMAYTIGGTPDATSIQLSPWAAWLQVASALRIVPAIWLVR